MSGLDWAAIGFGCGAVFAEAVQLLPMDSRWPFGALTNLAGRPRARQSTTLALIEALQPFAAIVADDGDDFSNYPPQVLIRCEVGVDEIHAAREALRLAERTGE